MVAQRPQMTSQRSSAATHRTGHRTGVMFVTIGAALSAFVVIVLAGGLYDPQKLPLLAFVQDRLGNGGVLFDMMVSGQQVQIRGSQGSALISGIACSIMLLGTLGKIARAFLSVGLRLMDRTVRTG